MKFNHLLQSQEGKTLEFKQDLSSPENIMKTLVEIENPGILLPGLTIEDMKQGMSKIRNQVIARTFRELDLIEQWGTGVQRIFQAAEELGLQEPEIMEIGMRVRMTIYLSKLHELSTSINKKVTGGVNELLEFIRSNPGGKSSDFRAALNQSQRTIERWLKHLKDEEKIEFRGAPKTGGYFVLGQ